MRPQEPGLGGLLGPLELIKHFPGEPCAASDRRRWVGLEALRYREQPPNEAFQPPLTHHSLVLFIHTPKEFELPCDGVNRVVPPPAGSILVVPAGSPARWRWSSHSDSLHVFLEPGLVERVAAEAFELEAMVKASGLDRNLLVAANTVLDLKHYLGSLFSCSALVVEAERSRTGRPIFGRNMDYLGLGYLHEYTLVTVYRPRGQRAFVAVGYPGMVGVVSGINDAGLAVTALETTGSEEEIASQALFRPLHEVHA
jgi:hypothetical protein